MAAAGTGGARNFDMQIKVRVQLLSRLAPLLLTPLRTWLLPRAPSCLAHDDWRFNRGEDLAAAEIRRR